MNHLSTGNTNLTGYYPGAIGKITEIHAQYYFKNWNFDISFEAQVGRELSDFMTRFNKIKDGLWIFKSDDDFAGSIAIDSNLAETEGARLRWFIVEPLFQGNGIGAALLQKAILHCIESKIPSIYLWTFAGLDAARKRYEKEQFKLVEEHSVFQWGRLITEQKFTLKF
jgi:GNAT superfamily N-acetyltransferase